MRIALGIEYQGAAFCGWQSQSGVRTVQDCVERALAVVANAPVRTICAGRTDTGVHAFNQVVHFDPPTARAPRAWVFGANAHLPPDIAVRWALPVIDDFHARFSALRRHYRYIILDSRTRPAVMAGRVSWSFRALDELRMREAAAHLIGEHDFSSFRSYACQANHPVRTVYRLDVTRHGDLIMLDVVANAFLHHMVRNIAGVLMEIGSGRQPVEWSRTVLEARDRVRGGVTAPPEGLYLVRVEYPPEYGVRYEPETLVML
ncbi:MAG: tRNA pseudouridine(38-40) synthase TruA [Chromatiales bacterium]|jgi:tRNA pseudouridine38-40 synthase|nr:tRNA pseudouridine(38-40) synthase TruA [Chromatiales bacterium]